MEFTKMDSKKKSFYGKDVTEAIKKACDAFDLPQEKLEIDVIETGSTGIFGLIRKKAHIKVQERIEERESPGRRGPEKTPSGRKKRAEKDPSAPDPVVIAPDETAQKDDSTPQELPLTDEDQETPQVPDEIEEEGDENLKAGEQNSWPPSKQEEESEEELEPEVLALVEAELKELLQLLGYPSTLEITGKGSGVFCRIGEEHADVLIGEDGKVLDAMQYLLRKIIARKIPSRLRLSLDVGNYREKRMAELQKQAAEFAAQTIKDGKTRSLNALSPSERRAVHISLQEEKQIRSRSVGDGLFKKILIYKPGKGGSRKRPGYKGRGPRKKQD